MRTLSVLMTGALLVSACAPAVVQRPRACDFYRYVYVDPAFSRQDQAAIRAAVDVWNDALRGYECLAVSPEPARWGIGIWRTTKGNPARPMPDYSKDVGAWAWTTILGNAIYIVRDMMEPGDVQLVTMHEIGHTLGADHTEGGLMNRYSQTPDSGSNKCIDRAALEQVAEVMKVPIKEMKSCP